MTRFSTFLAASLLSISPALAQTDADRTGAQAVISQLIVDTAENDIEGILSVTPPALLATFAAMSGRNPDEMAVLMQAQMRELMAQVNVESYEMDLDVAQGAVTSTGRSYFVVPSRMTMEVIGAGRLLTTSETLVFEDGGQWWLVNVENPSMGLILAQAYPDLTGIEFAPATMEELQ
jgi:hypothetical protein